MNRVNGQNAKRIPILQRVLAGCFLLLSLQTLKAVAATDMDVHKQVRDAIEVYAQEVQNQNFEQFEVDSQPLDSRLRLSACDQPLIVEHRPRNRTVGRLTMRVECRGADNWAIHVPVTVSAFANVVIADMPIAKGTQITERDIRVEARDVSLIYSGYFNSVERVKGFVSKRPIPAGQVLNPTVLDPAKMINRGEKVVIVAEGRGLNIRTTGVAMNDGAYGELIQVRNSNTDKVVEGRIDGPGRIKVSL